MILFISYFLPDINLGDLRILQLKIYQKYIDFLMMSLNKLFWNHRPLIQISIRFEVILSILEIGTEDLQGNGKILVAQTH
jgi:hypothetical protein